MSFWSGEKLKSEVKNCIEGQYDADDGIDCAAYTLHVGSEIFVTPDHYESNPHQNTIRELKSDEAFNIPSGMFAFLVTEEVIKVPNYCIAFISMKAKMKFKGLVNVSGFHVDPGYKGKLIFSVYNAGPMPITLKQGLPLFLIWYADLDKPSEKIKNEAPKLDLGVDIINQIHGPIFSPQEITKRISEFNEDITNNINQLNKKVSDKIHEIDLKVSRIIAVGSVISLLVISIFGFIIRDIISNGNNVPEDNVSLNNEKAILNKKTNSANGLPEVLDKKGLPNKAP